MAADDNTPWIGFRFLVEFSAAPVAASGGADEGAAEPLCDGAFSEVSGLEASMEPKAIKEGGLNHGAHQRAGSVSFATVVLKRGMTSARHLWQWWSLFAGAGADDGGSPNGAMAHRLTVRITQQAADATPLLVWKLVRAMPVKFKAGDLNARTGEVAVEELHLVHEGLHLEAP
jgi:phage tail-like protein